MRLGSDLRTLLLRPVSTSHRLSISAQKDTDQSLRGSHAPPISRRSIVTVSFRLTLPHHIPQEGLLSSSSPVYTIQFGNSTRFIIVERSRSVCQGGRGEHLLLNLIPTPPLLVPAFIAKKRPKSFFCSLVFSILSRMIPQFTASVPLLPVPFRRHCRCICRSS